MYVIIYGTAICRIHWPEDAPFILYRGKLRPSEPLSLFSNIPSSCLSPLPPKARKTTLASDSKRNMLPDELECFYEQDLLVIETIPETLAEELELVVYSTVDMTRKLLSRKLSIVLSG